MVVVIVVVVVVVVEGSPVACSVFVVLILAP